MYKNIYIYISDLSVVRSSIVSHTIQRFLKIYQNVYKKVLWLTGSLEFFIFHHFFIELCYFQSSIISILTLFGAAHGGKKTPPP